MTRIMGFPGNRSWRVATVFLLVFWTAIVSAGEEVKSPAKKDALPVEEILTLALSLGKDDFKVRKESTRRLLEIAKTSADAKKTVQEQMAIMARSSDPETAQRAKEILRTLDPIQGHLGTIARVNYKYNYVVFTPVDVGKERLAVGDTLVAGKDKAVTLRVNKIFKNYVVADIRGGRSDPELKENDPVFWSEK